MTKAKKYDYRVAEENGCWSAEIIRRASSKKTVVSKSQGGFATEAEAQAWAQQEIVTFLQGLNDKNKQRSIERVPVINKWDAIAKRPAKATKESGAAK